jgi:serine phosphatase RsbU (regulator of sigma subunit)
MAATPIWSGFETRRAGDIIRAIPALWISALTVKLLVWFFAPAQVALDRGINFVLIALAVASVFRLARLGRSDLLWSVSRKLILSYILVGAVPILLLVTFFLVGILSIFFDVSSYLVHSRISNVTAQTATIARTTLSEALTLEEPAREAMVARRVAALAERYPQVRITLVTAESVPAWARGGFAGLVDGADTVRAVAVRKLRSRGYALIVDLPVAAALDRSELSAAGVTLGEARARSLFNSATYLTAVDWNTGASDQVTVGLSVDVPMLYGWLVAAPLRQAGSASVDRAARANFNRIVLYMLLSIGVLLCVIEFVALGHGLALARTITTSVHELFSGTERVKAGEFAARIPVHADDQLGQLSASFNDMTARIQALVAEQDEKRRLEEELRIAREIQMSLLPRDAALQAPGLSMAALCAPAREVGGDYYDVLPLDDGRVGLLIADVSGKGTSAALYMAELKGLMLSLSRIHSSPRELLIDANRIIARHLDSRSFITMTYAVVDTAGRTLTCARAGHTPFIRVRVEDGVPRSEVFVPDGMVLGLNLDGGRRFERCLEELTIPLVPGDLFFFFTDGISEAMDAGGACFGESRLAAFLEAHADRQPAELRDRLIAEVGAFVLDQPQHDDITMVIVKIEGVAD